MLDPKKITVTREPLIVNGLLTFIGTMVFNVRETLRAELFPPNDPPMQAQIIDQVEKSLATKAHLAAYGDLIAPVLKLAWIARKAPPNYQYQAEQVINELSRLLRIKHAAVPGAAPTVTSETKLDKPANGS